ncbi:response regulator [Sphingomonas montanisoli]|uniref:Response regulator n=1 Tax=Sphingomonas montanisoli TaxID=2606412 RepID=A0A5D9C3W7_9SPHN|nr:response regulator [Sphingomonas montanisoli]TZG26206.1 response regulator [Sphingomonas montanisoli]
MTAWDGYHDDMESPACILIVEDDESVRLSLSLLLETLGLTVVSTSSGTEALAAMTRRFDIFLIDMGLPDMDGTTLAMRLRRIAPATPAIIMSADHDRLRNAAPLAVCLLEKPISAHAMTRAIRDAAPNALMLPSVGARQADGLRPPAV